MIVQFITVVVLSIVFILLAWAIYRTLKKPMPGSLIPMIIGLTVIGYGIYSEYTWASRMMAQMPDSMVAVHRISGKSAFSPWAYVIPRTDRLSVVDTSAIRRNPEHPNYVMLDLQLLQRYNPVITVSQLVDCKASRRADLPANPEFDEQGLPKNLQWEDLNESHALIKAVCIETETTS